MLTGAKKMGERISVGPAGAWFQGQLWVAYAAVDGSLFVRSADVLKDAANTFRYATGYSCSETTSAAVWANRLYVLFGTAGDGYQLTSTEDGVTFDPPTAVPIVEGFTGISGLTAYSGGLAVVWAENAGGQAHLLQSGDGGATFADTELPFSVFPSVAVTAYPGPAELVIAYGADRSGADSFTIVTVNPDRPDTIVGFKTTPTPAFPSSVAVCATRYHGKPGVHVAVQERTDNSFDPYQARSAPADLQTVGGEEPFLFRAIDLSLTYDGTRAWVAWRGNVGDEVDELFIGPYVNVFDLPSEVRDLLDKECDERTCPPDPRLVCTATDRQVWRQAAPTIHNAERGDLVLTPGDGSGLIGTVLNALDPRQDYDHMGIMIGDDLVRHATMAHQRLNRRQPGRYMTGDFLGEMAPINGFRPDALTYGWPGTITQSVEDGFYTGFNTTDPVTSRPFNPHADFFALNPGAKPLPRPADDAPEKDQEAWRDQHRFADPEYPADKPIAIHNLPNKPAYRMDTKETIYAVLVKPAAGTDLRIRQMVQRVTDAAVRISGHYRFYCYTDARISLDGSRAGPPAGDPTWRDKPAGAAWCAGTLPVVCSSFVWTAIQLANAAYPRIEVEGDVTESPDELLASPTVDGLYRYEPAEREAAGRALHARVVNQVKKQVYDAVVQFKHENRVALDLARFGLDGLASLVAGGDDAGVLGASASTLTSLSLLLEDMPNDVATQLCNALAKDKASETDDDLWESPGEGLAVSPDDILKFWDAADPESHGDLWHGLYGQVQRLLLTPRRPELRRIHILERSSGPALVRGRVTYGGDAIVGAKVRFGCETTATVGDPDEGPIYQLDVSAGRHEAVATAYWPSTGELLTGRRVVQVEAGDQAGPIDIRLEDPPEWRRIIRCLGHIEVVRKVIVGKDDWVRTPINLEGWVMKTPAGFGVSGGSVKWSDRSISEFAQRFNVRVDVDVELKDDLSIVVNARSALCAHYRDPARGPTADEIVTSRQGEALTVPPGGSTTIIFDHNSGNVPPDRAHVEFVVTNVRAPV